MKAPLRGLRVAPHPVLVFDGCRRSSPPACDAFLCRVGHMSVTQHTDKMASLQACGLVTGWACTFSAPFVMGVVIHLISEPARRAVCCCASPVAPQSYAHPHERYGARTDESVVLYHARTGRCDSRVKMVSIRSRMGASVRERMTHGCTRARTDAPVRARVPRSRTDAPVRARLLPVRARMKFAYGW